MSVRKGRGIGVGRPHRSLVGMLTAFLLATAGVVLAPTPAHAVGCVGNDCDNKGPKANGCMGDDVVVGSGGGGLIQLRHSAACHAYFAYGPWAPTEVDGELHLEMQWKNDSGVWVLRQRLIVTFEAVGSGANVPDWTNMLGDRNTRFRYRALYTGPAVGAHGPYATPWALGIP